jgi:hypothetical protein
MPHSLASPYYFMKRILNFGFIAALPYPQASLTVFCNPLVKGNYWD